MSDYYDSSDDDIQIVDPPPTTINFNNSQQLINQNSNKNNKEIITISDSSNDEEEDEEEEESEDEVELTERRRLIEVERIWRGRGEEDEEESYSSQPRPPVVTAEKVKYVSKKVLSSSQPLVITTKKNPTTTSDDLPDLRILPSLNKSRSLGSTSSTSASASTSKASASSLTSITTTTKSKSAFRPSGLAATTSNTSAYQFPLDDDNKNEEEYDEEQERNLNNSESDDDLYVSASPPPPPRRLGSTTGASQSYSAADKGKGKERAREVIEIESSPPPFIPLPPRLTSKEKGKGKMIELPDSDSDDDGMIIDDDDMEDDTPLPPRLSLSDISGAGNGNGNGKKRRKSRSPSLVFTSDEEEEESQVTVGGGGNKNKKQKQSTIASGDSDGEDEEGIGARKTKKAKTSGSQSQSQPRAKKAVSKSPTKKQQEALVKKASKEALKISKAKDMEYKKLLRSVNVLKRRRVDTLGEITVRCSGKAFDSLDDDVDGAGAAGKSTTTKKKSTKPSPWLAITSSLSERLEILSTTEANKDSGEYICRTLLPELPRLDVLDCEGVIRWTRVCSKKWNGMKGLFEPLENGKEILVEEDSRLVFVTAQTISTHIASNNLLAYIQSRKAALPSHINLFIMIYGLQTLFNKIKNSQAAVYRDGIRNGGVDLENGNEKFKGKGRAVGIGEDQPSRETIELEVMRVQMATKVFLIHCEKEEDATTWIEQLTLDVGYKPYKRQMMAPEIALGTTEFTIQVGKTHKETYMHMLSSIKGITQPIARSIVGEYPSIRHLYDGWSECNGEKEKREMLVGIWKNNNKNGTMTNRAMGSALSTLVYNVFSGKDPTMSISSATMQGNQGII